MEGGERYYKIYAKLRAKGRLVRNEEYCNTRVNGEDGKFELIGLTREREEQKVMV